MNTMNIINKILEFFAKDKNEFRNKLNEKESLKNAGVLVSADVVIF